MIFKGPCLVVLAAVLCSPLVYGSDIAVVQKGKRFVLGDKTAGKDGIMRVDAKVGDTLVFENGDDITHNVYSLSDGNSFDPQVQAPSSKIRVALSSDKHKKGEMLVECAIHPQMKLIVNIK